MRRTMPTGTRYIRHRLAGREASRSRSERRAGTEHREGGAMILATTTVEDVDRFVEIFSTKGAEKRKEHGSKGSTVFRDPNEDDRVWVLFDWDGEGWTELRLRPRGPGDPAGGRARGQAPGGGDRRPVRRLGSSARRRSTRSPLPPWPSPGGSDLAHRTTLEQPLLSPRDWPPLPYRPSVTLPRRSPAMLARDRQSSGR